MATSRRAGIRRSRAIDYVAVNYFTRMRFLPGRRARFETKESAESAPADCTPGSSACIRTSSRGASCSDTGRLEGRASWCRALDTGCVWGGCLTLLRLEDERRWQIPRARARGLRAGAIG